MRIAVIGAGPVGRAVGGGWTRAGHEVRYGSRSPAGDTVGIAEALDGAAVALLAVPGAALPDLLDRHGADLAGADPDGTDLVRADPDGADPDGAGPGGRLVVDATNLVGGPTLHQVPLLTARLPTTRVARAFCTVGWEVLADPVLDGQVADLFWCGPAGAGVETLIADTGARPVRVGDLDAADVLDGVARLWFALTFGQGRGRRHGLRVLDGIRSPG